MLKTVILDCGMLTSVIDVVHERSGNTDFYRADATIEDLALHGLPSTRTAETGRNGTRAVRVKGDLPTGTYEASLTFVGRNYCSITVPPTIHVGQEPPPADAGSEGGDTDGAIDGAVDGG